MIMKIIFRGVIKQRKKIKYKKYADKKKEYL